MSNPSPCRRNWKLLALIAAFAAVCGCAAPATQQVPAADPDRWITDVVSREEESHWAFTVKGNRPLDYTLQEQKDPAGLVLLFPATGLDRLQETIQPPENPAIEVIRLRELQDGGRAVRMLIALKSPLPHEIRPEGSDLVIRFAKAAPRPADPVPAAAPKETDLAQAAAPQAAPALADRGTGPATSLSRIEAEAAERSAVIRVQADGTLENFRSFTMSEEPPRIVFDFPGLKSPFRGEQRMTLKGGPVGRVRHFATAERLRLVVETRAEYLKKYRAEPVADGLRILVGEDLPTVAGAAPKPAPAPALSPARADRPVWVNRLEFAEEEGGRSAVIVGTTGPVNYELVPSGEREVRLRLAHTRLPEKYSRPLITTRFESAVDRVTPIGAAGETVLAVQLREKVEVAAEQTGNVIRLNVAASRIPPKPYEGAEPPTWKTEAAPAVLSAAAVPPAVRPAAAGAAAAPFAPPRGGSRVENLSGPEEKVYTGEKIALDFYDTDIRNVFRILQEISGKNFAIDKNVTGKVTLALQKPVPWDQVLDLVLKMNQLGMTREGDIIRIATLATLQQEEKLRQAQLKAEQEARKQEEEGEPLITEYIPVNYSNAKTDILPHVANILTKDRGKASVDERNNQVIVTDIAEKVRQAKAIVARIDRVTPQVIIEARVVEATSNFTREIGFDWGTISVNAFKIGGALKVGPTAFRADNIPNTFTANNSIGFNFSTLFGTNISIIDAKLAASELEGKSNVISSPKIITLSGRKATIKQGLEVPYQERDSSGNSTVRFKNVDLLLDVTPNISQDRRIVMNILLTKNDVIDPTAKEPALSTNEAKTEILVEDGDTIVIGGILKDTKRLADSGIPGLRKLPAVGWLFRSEKIENQKNELLIFITPRIIQLEQRKLA